jgi:GNAT superfamily N-acetyltransferase
MTRTQQAEVRHGTAPVPQSAGPARQAALIREAGAADLPALRAFFAGLETMTRYRRFFAAIVPSPSMLAAMSGESGDADCIVAECGGSIVGHAMAADRGAGPAADRGTDQDAVPIATDIGVVVADSWQGHGLGSALVRTLVTRATARGAGVLTMDVLPGNYRVIAMIRSHWPQARTSRSADSIVFSVPLGQANGHAQGQAQLPAPSLPRSLPATLAAALPTAPGTECAGLASNEDSSSMSLTICSAIRRRFGVPSRSADVSLLT